MFLKYIRSRRSATGRQLSILYLFRNSRFQMAIILVGCYLGLSVIPNLIFCLMTLDSIFILGRFNEAWNTLDFCLYIINIISDTADGLIYILVYPPIRNLLRKKLEYLANWRIKATGGGVSRSTPTISLPVATTNRTLIIKAPISIVPDRHQYSIPLNTSRLESLTLRPRSLSVT